MVEMVRLTYTRLSVCRAYFNTGKTVFDVSLHVFSDASLAAYDSVVYLRVVYVDVLIETILVHVKSEFKPFLSQSELCLQPRVSIMSLNS